MRIYLKLRNKYRSASVTITGIDLEDDDDVSLLSRRINALIESEKATEVEITRREKR